MQTYLKTKPWWVQLLLFLSMAFGLFIVAAGIGAMVLETLTGVGAEDYGAYTAWDSPDKGILNFMRGLTVLQFLFLFAIPSLVFAYFSDPYPKQYLGLRKPHRGWWWLLGIVAMLVAYPAVEGLGALNQQVSFGTANEWFRRMEDDATKRVVFMLRGAEPMELVKNLLFVALLAGVGEELFFRGVLQRLFIRGTGKPWLGIIIAAAVFSLFHFQFFGFLPRLFLGVVLGAIYWYSGSLWVAMLVHFLYDAAVITIVYFNPQLLNDPSGDVLNAKGIALAVITVLSLAATYFLLRQMQRRSLTRFEAVYADDFPKPANNPNHGL